MFPALMLSLAFGSAPPEADKGQTVKEPELVLPKGSEHWDYIGTFVLKQEKHAVTVRLYALDSDSVAEKRLKKGLVGIHTYPNSFALHVVMRTESGPWIHQRLYSAARVRFLDIERCTSDRIVLRFRPNFTIFIKPNEPVGDALKRAEEVNKPFTQSLLIENGVLTIK